MDIDFEGLKGANYEVFGGLDPHDFLCDAVSPAGHINGDGRDDFVVIAILADQARINGAGEACMMFDHSREIRNEG